MFLSHLAQPQPLASALEALAVLSLGVAGIVSAGWLSARCARSAVWAKTAWRAALLAAWLFVGCELTGLTRGALGWLAPAAPRDPRASRAESRELPIFDDRFEPTALEKSLWLEPRLPWSSPTDQANPAPLELSNSLGSFTGDEAMPANPGSGSHREAFPADASTAAAHSHAAETRAADKSSVSHPIAAAFPFVLAVWLVVFGLLVLRSCVGRVLLARFVSRCRLVEDEGLLRRWGEVCGRLGIRPNARLLESLALGSPVAVGIRWPAVVVPSRFAKTFTDSQQQAMLAHEAAHLAGRDPFWQAMAELLAALLWWHPLVWWLRANLRTANELVADEASLIVADGPELLAECLVRIGGHKLRRSLGYVAAAGDGFRSSLGRRVARLLSLSGSGPRPNRRRPLFTALFAAAALVPAAALMTSFARSEVPPQGDDDMSLLKQSWRSSLAGMALFALLGNDVQSQDSPPNPEGDRQVEPRREGDRPDAPREGDRPRGEGDRERRPDAPPRERDRRPDAPREGERRPDAPREGDRRFEGPRPDGPGGEAMRRAHHLMMAAENLEAAGMGDRAEEFRREAQGIMEAIRREHPDQGDRPAEPGRRVEGRGGPLGVFRMREEEEEARRGRRDAEPMGGGTSPDMARVLGELNRQLQELRAEVEQLRREVRREGDGSRGGGSDRRDAEPRGEAERARNEAEAARAAAQRAEEEARVRIRELSEAGDRAARQAAEREAAARLAAEVAERARREAEQRQAAARQEREENRAREEEKEEGEEEEKDVPAADTPK